MKMRSKQALVALIVFVSVIVGLVIHTGTGTLCALGWRDIALICPVGVLETLAGSKSLLLHPLILLAVAVLIAFFAGRAFCGWACPVPHVENFFHPKRSKRTQHGVEAAGKGDPEKSAPSDSERPAPAETAAIMQDDWANRSPNPFPQSEENAMGAMSTAGISSSRELLQAPSHSVFPSSASSAR